MKNMNTFRMKQNCLSLSRMGQLFHGLMSTSLLSRTTNSDFLLADFTTNPRSVIATRMKLFQKLLQNVLGKMAEVTIAMEIARTSSQNTVTDFSKPPFKEEGTEKSTTML